METEPEQIMDNQETTSISSNDENLETWLDLLGDNEIEELSETVAEMMEEYVYGQISKISDPKFSTIVCDDLTAYFFDIWTDAEICMDTDADYKEVRRFICDVYTKYMDEYSILPLRQCAIDSPCIKVDVAPSLERISTIPQPKQKTREWYEKRYGMLTASNISKALGSESQRNSLIYEKCKPLTMEHQYGSVNTENSMHWGVKYEPISAAIYEHMYSVKLSDFGCIPHEKYVFIGASPDGIVCDPDHPRYGHMVEIKNIVNREITGIPKEEYWIQMQVQLETCNLEYCDFIETRIKEYENAIEYYTDREHTYKGVVLYFVKKMLIAGALPDVGDETGGKYNVPHYEYMPLDIPIAETEQWIQDKKAELQEEYVLYRKDYWYLDNISCVLVQRNREWFDMVVPQFIDIWETIEKERVSGYAHRAAVKKPKPLVVVQQNLDDSTVMNRNIQMGGGGGICLIKLDEAGNNISQPSTTDLHNILLL
jgi:putative phage-type endonuclease